MKKALILILVLTLMFSFTSLSAGAAEVSDDWKAVGEENFTMNDDGSLRIKGKGNIGLYYSKEISGDFTLELKATSSEFIEGTDQKFTVSLFATTDDNWMTGYWLRFNYTELQFNDGTRIENDFAGPAAGDVTPVEIKKDFNTVKIEYKGGKVTYTINGTKALTVTPSNTSGKYICIGANYSGDESLLTQEFTVKDVKLTMGGETYEYFTVEDDSAGSSSETVSSNPDTADASLIMYTGIAFAAVIVFSVSVIIRKRSSVR